MSDKIPLGKRHLVRPEAVLVKGTVRFEDMEETGRRFFWVDLDDSDGYFGSVAFCDIAIPGMCSGSSLSHSDQMTEKDLKYLFSLPEGTLVEVIIRRQCGH